MRKSWRPCLRLRQNLSQEQGQARAIQLCVACIQVAQTQSTQNFDGLPLFAIIACNDSIESMATITIRQLDEKTKIRLRVRAAHHGRSMEEEAREILRSALAASSPAKANLAEIIRRRFAAFGGLELELPSRDAIRQAPGFGE